LGAGTTIGRKTWEDRLFFRAHAGLSGAPWKLLLNIETEKQDIHGRLPFDLKVKS